MQLSYFHFTMNKIRLIFFQKKKRREKPTAAHWIVIARSISTCCINNTIEYRPDKEKVQRADKKQFNFKIRANWRVGILLSPFRPRRRVRPPSLLGLQEEYKFRDFFGCQDIIIQYIDSNIQHPDSNVQRDGSLVKGELSLACQK